MPLEVLLNWGTLEVGVSLNMSRAERKWGTVPEVKVPGTLGAIPVVLNVVKPGECKLGLILEVGEPPKAGDIMPLEVLLNWRTLEVGVSFNMSRAERKWGTVPEVEVPGTLGAIPVVLNLVRPGE